MLKMICGSSGSGKTKLLTEQIAYDINNKKRCYLLVPEQQAYISERDLPSLLPPNAGLYFEVVNFSGLAEKVFRKYGGVTKPSLNPGLQYLLMWDTLRTLSPLLSRYGKGAAQDLALTKLMMQTVGELRCSGIGADELENASKQLPDDSELRKKLADLSLIDATYHQRVEEAFGADPSDRLLRLARLLQEHAFFTDSNLYIDSFTDFTAQEYAVIAEILKQADCVTVSLLSDDFSSRLAHFETVTDTARRLQKLALQADTQIERIRLAGHNHIKPLSLQIVERDLWRFDTLASDCPPIPLEEQNAVRLLRCSNLYEEAEAVVFNIMELVQNGLHYGDIAIVVRDTENYKGVLDAALERYGIPYFLSERTDLTAKPLSRLIFSALRAVGHHYRTQDVMTLVKTGLAGVNVADASMFEEYCETWHISGSRFCDSLWSMNPDGLTVEKSARAQAILDAANRVRKTVIEPLEILSAEMRRSSRLTDRCCAIYDYLNRLHISETLSQRGLHELESGQQRAAGETIRLYDFLNDTLTTLCTLFPKIEVTIDELISILTLMFSESDLGSVPNLYDCVVIGSAATLRVENVKASFLLGLCEGEFPRAITDDGLLTDTDKLHLEEIGLNLPSRSSTRASQELFYVYRAMAKPTKYLRLFTVAAKTDGSELTPSLAFSRVRLLLRQKPIEFDAEAIQAALGKPKFSDLEIQPLQAQAHPTGTNLRLSQTRLQTFMLCPYRYYCTYTLKLREKKDSRPSYADDGLFLHYVFEHFLKNTIHPGEEIQIPDPEKLESIADDILADYLIKVCPVPPEKMDARLLHLFARLRKLAIVMLCDILAELHNSLFVPTGFEQMIGASDGSGLPPVVLKLTDGSQVTLSGVIDRIDVCEINNHQYIRVVDYKSGIHQFSLEDVRKGLDIQLVLYLFSVISSDPAHFKPAGAQYLYAQTEKEAIHIKRSGILLNDPEIMSAADRSDGAVFTKKLITQTEDEIATLVDEMNVAVKSAAQRILRGDAEKTPSEKACSFCPVRPHCDQAYHK